jgi:hypothetical protein
MVGNQNMMSKSGNKKKLRKKLKLSSVARSLHQKILTNQMMIVTALILAVMIYLRRLG